MRPGRGRVGLLGLLILIVAVGGFAAWLVLARPGPDADRLWEEARRDVQAGRLDHAEAALARLDGLRPRTGLDWMLRAQVAVAKGQSDAALASLARVPDGHPIAPRARLRMGQMEMRRGRLRAAEVAFRAAVALDPKLVQAHRELVYIYGKQLRRAELNARFLALSELTPPVFDEVLHWCLLRTVDWEPAEVADEMARSLEADPGDRASRLALAECLLRLNRFDEAEASLAALPASDAEARVMRARVALARGDDSELAALLAEGPDDHPGLALLRGQMALARRDGPAALRHFRVAHAAEPDNREILVGKARAWILLGDDAAAAPFLAASRHHDTLMGLIQRAATPSGRKDPSLLHQLGAACEAVGRRPEARAWYTLALARDPLDAQAQHALFRLRPSNASASPPGPESSAVGDHIRRR